MKKAGFTFIEVMIAIVVFAIWVLAILGLVTSNLRWVERNDLRLQGTLLAKEWLELVYNLRDSNLERELPRNCVLSPLLYELDWERLSNLISDDTDIVRCINICNDDEDCKTKCIMDKICPTYFGISSPIKISYSDANYVMVDRTIDGIDSWNKLYIHTWDGWLLWYSHEEQWWDETLYYRYITFDDIKENNLSLDTEKILKVSSHVIWEKWAFTGEVVLQSFIWNY